MAIAIVVVLCIAAIFVCTYLANGQNDELAQEGALKVIPQAKKQGDLVTGRVQGFGVALGPHVQKQMVAVSQMDRNSVFLRDRKVMSFNLGNSVDVVEREIRKKMVLAITIPGVGIYEFKIKRIQNFLAPKTTDMEKLLEFQEFTPEDNPAMERILQDGRVRQALLQLESIGDYTIACTKDEMTFELPGKTFEKLEEVECFIRASLLFFQGVGGILAKEADLWVEEGLMEKVDWDSPTFAQEPARGSLADVSPDVYDSVGMGGDARGDVEVTDESMGIRGDQGVAGCLPEGYRSLPEGGAALARRERALASRRRS